jgi:hypothetical protein
MLPKDRDHHLMMAITLQSFGLVGAQDQPIAIGSGVLRSHRDGHLLAAAVIVGRMPGEPPTVLTPRIRPSLLDWLIGTPVRTPLADPALEVVRAISASLASGATTIRRDLLAAAYRAGLTAKDLRSASPGIGLERPSA